MFIPFYLFIAVSSIQPIPNFFNLNQTVESRAKKSQDSYLELLHLGVNGPLSLGFLVVREQLLLQREAVRVDEVPNSLV